jgi:hypothetical protein
MSQTTHYQPRNRINLGFSIAIGIGVGAALGSANGDSGAALGVPLGVFIFGLLSLWSNRSR